MGFIEKLVQEGEAWEAQIVQDRDRRKREKAAKEAADREKIEKLRRAEEESRSARIFLQESGILGLLKEAKKGLRRKGYSHTILRVYTQGDGEVGDYQPLLSKGDVVVHLRWGKVGKLDWQRDWPASRMEEYQGISVSVSSDGVINIPNGESLPLEKWRADKGRLHDALWRAYRGPLALNYSDVESRRRKRK